MSDIKQNKSEDTSECQIMINIHIGYNANKVTTGYPLLYRARQAIDKVLKEESFKDNINYSIIRWNTDNFKIEEEFDFGEDL
jgi:hypothetical protein